MHFYKFFALFSWTDILPKKILAQDYLNSLEQMQEEEGADYWNRRMVHISHLDRSTLPACRRKQSDRQ